MYLYLYLSLHLYLYRWEATCKFAVRRNVLSKELKLRYFYVSEKFACICAHLEYAIYLFCILQILRPIVTKSKRRKNEPIHFPIFGKVQAYLRIPIPKRETWLIRQHPCDFILFFKFFSQKSGWLVKSAIKFKAPNVRRSAAVLSGSQKFHLQVL